MYFFLFLSILIILHMQLTYSAIYLPPVRLDNEIACGVWWGEKPPPYILKGLPPICSTVRPKSVFFNLAAHCMIGQSTVR